MFPMRGCEANTPKLGGRKRIQVAGDAGFSRFAEPLEHRRLFSGGGHLPPIAYFEHPLRGHPLIASSIEVTDFRVDARPDFLEPSSADRAANFVGSPAMPAMDDLGESEPGRDPLLSHFARGEGAGAPSDDASQDCPPIIQKANPETTLEEVIFASSKAGSESHFSDSVEHPFVFAPPMQIVVSGEAYPSEQLFIVGVRPPGGDGGFHSFGVARPDAAPAPPSGASAQRLVAREARIGDAGGDLQIVASPTHAARTVLPLPGTGSAIQAILVPSTFGMQAFSQAANRLTEAARFAPGLFATTVVADVDRVAGSVIVTPAAVIHAAVSGTTDGAGDGLAPSIAAQESGVIVAAQSILRLFRSFATSAGDVGPSTAGDASVAPQPEGWSAPMFMSAELLGLAPGSAWASTNVSPGQRTLRWVAGVSLLITVAGCWYCAAVSARARRAADDLPLEEALHIAC